MNLDFLTNYGQKNRTEASMLKLKLEAEKKNKDALKNCISFLKIRGVKIDVDKLRKKSRVPKIVFLRSLVAITLNHYRVTKSDIGKILNVDHTTVIHMLKYGEKKTHQIYVSKINEIKFALQNATSKVLKEIERKQKEIEKLKKSIHITN